MLFSAMLFSSTVGYDNSSKQSLISLSFFTFSNTKQSSDERRHRPRTMGRLHESSSRRTLGRNNYRASCRIYYCLPHNVSSSQQIRTQNPSLYRYPHYYLWCRSLNWIQKCEYVYCFEILCWYCFGFSWLCSNFSYRGGLSYCSL
jgi:hypothetical protein